MIYEIPYSPRQVFRPFHQSQKRWSVLCCHRGAGKSVASINHLIKKALETKKGVFAFISPTYTQGKRIIWQYIKDFTRDLPRMDYNEAELKARFPSGSLIYILGSENPDSLRGMHLDGVVFDEYSQQPAHIFGEIIRPALSAKQGFSIWIGTIKGKNTLWNLWDKHKEDPDWFTLYLKASESGIIPKEELVKARSSMSEEEFFQEYELEPTAAIRGAYYTDLLRVMREKNHITDVPYDSMLPVSAWFDLGMDDSTSIVFVQFFGAQKRCIDYYEMTGMGLEHYVGVMKAKGYVYDTIWLPHDAKVRELGTGKSRFEVLKSLLPGVDVQICPRIAQGTGREVVEGINAVRSTLPTLWLDRAKCARLIDCLENYRHEWDEELGVFRPKPLHDQYSHGADCLRYFSVTASLQMRTQEQNLSPAYSGSILPSRPIFNGDTVRR